MRLSLDYKTKRSNVIDPYYITLNVSLHIIHTISVAAPFGVNQLPRSDISTNSFRFIIVTDSRSSGGPHPTKTKVQGASNLLLSFPHAFNYVIVPVLVP